MPRRIRLRRLSTWRKPTGCITVARPTMWGNPWKVTGCTVLGLDGQSTTYPTPNAAAAAAVDWYRLWLVIGTYHEQLTLPQPEVDAMEKRRQRILTHLPELRGRDLACWCRDGEPCHANVLIDLAQTGFR